MELGQHKHKREDSIEMNLTEIGWVSVNWIHLLAGYYKRGNEL
jgi:hypothetical protein